MVIVTDVPWVDKHGRVKIGYYMDGWLAQNLAGAPAYLKKAWDVVGIVSGHGKVRIGKSTMAMQIAYYLAWILAGGKMEVIDGKYVVTKSPDKPVRFGLENIVFSPRDLMKKARDLYNTYGKNQIILYDEGRAGLDSARAMEAINKAMQDFFQECGFYGHVILIVLPNYFKLHEDYAVSRSIFLADVYANQKLERGYFNFYNEKQKEWLYYMGKKKIGASLKYSGVNPSFQGRFGQFLPVDKDEYERLKALAISKKEVGFQEKRWKIQRDAGFYLLSKQCDWTYDKIASEINGITGEKIGSDSIKWGVAAVRKNLGEKTEET